MNEPVHYRVTLADPRLHLFAVRMVVARPAPEGQLLTLPAWIPGSYMIRDFARNIVAVAAYSGGREVALTKVDKQSWRAAPCAGPLELEYEVYAWDLSVRAAHLDTTHAYFNGTSLFLCAAGLEHAPCALELPRPEGEGYAGWRVATTLPTREVDDDGFGRYGASDYDELIDHPVEMGTFASVAFEAAGVSHEMVFTGRQRADLERIARDLKPVVECHVRLFGELPVAGRYLFQTLVVGEGYGGLEHRSSTSLICARNDLPRPGEEAIGEGYRNFLGLCSHEYFHLWNVKRIKPAAFIPYDLSREGHTRLLWAFEGITSYYDELALVRAGVITPESYLELLGQTLTRVRRGAGRTRQSLEESSFDAWTKFYKQDENAPNAIVSYYAKGALVALALDLMLREECDGAVTLDDLMRALWRDYGSRGVGVPEEGIERLAEEVSGLPLSGFFDLALRSTDDIPLERLLARVGVHLEWRPAESAADKGGRASTKTPEQLAGRAEIGARVVDEGGGAKLASVFSGGAAHLAGLSAGDVVVAVGGLRASGGNLERLLEAYRPGETVELHAFRRDELMRFDVQLQGPAADTAVLTLMETVDAATRARRDAWLWRAPEGAGIKIGST